MFIDREYLEHDRHTAIEVITSLKHEKRREGADIASIERSITAHMDRLASLDRELIAMRNASARISEKSRVRRKGATFAHRLASFIFAPRFIHWPSAR